MREMHFLMNKFFGIEKKKQKIMKIAAKRRKIFSDSKFLMHRKTRKEKPEEKTKREEPEKKNQKKV